MKNLMKRAFDKIVTIAGVGELKAIIADKLLIGDVIVNKNGTQEVVNISTTATGMSKRLELKDTNTDNIQKTTVRTNSLFALLDQDLLHSLNDEVLEDIKSLNSETIANLTNLTQDIVLNKIQREFYEYVEISQIVFNTWKEAWKSFNSPEQGVYSFVVNDTIEEKVSEQVEEVIDLVGDIDVKEVFETVKEIPEEMEFIVSDMELPKLERIIKKSKKLGTGIMATIVPDRIEEIELKYQTVAVQLHKVTLKRPVENEVQDHKIIGKITLTGLDENIVEPYWGLNFNFEQFKHCNVTCQHCNINRYRKNLYIVQNLKSGEVLTIGKSCLGDVFKIADIERYVKYLEYYFELFKEFSDSDIEGSGRDRFLSDALEKEQGLSFLKTEDCLAYIKKIIDRDGYVSRNASSNSNKDATADIVKNEFRDADIVSLGDKTSPELKKLITKDIEFYVENQDTSVEYNKMLVDMIQNKYVLKSKAYLLSGFFVSNDILKEKLKRDKQKSISQFIGVKGVKIETKAEFVRVVSFQNPFSYYDYINIYIFKDCEGNVFTWKTGKEMELTQGDKLNIQCTVKEHTVYDGEKQTVVIRLKIKD